MQDIREPILVTDLLYTRRNDSVPFPNGFDAEE